MLVVQTPKPGRSAEVCCDGASVVLVSAPATLDDEPVDVGVQQGEDQRQSVAASPGLVCRTEAGDDDTGTHREAGEGCEQALAPLVALVDEVQAALPWEAECPETPTNGVDVGGGDLGPREEVLAAAATLVDEGVQGASLPMACDNGDRSEHVGR